MPEQDAKPPASPEPAPSPGSGAGDQPQPPGSAPVGERQAGARRRRKTDAREKTVVVERRRGFFARWFSRLVALLLVLAILILLLFVGVTLLLRSDVPRSIAESGASSALGLELGVGGLDVGWNGDVTLTDVVVRLPSLDRTEGEKVLEVPRIHAELGALPRVALDYLAGGSPRVKRVEIESPILYATQAQGGEWNLTRAISLLASAGGPDDPSRPPRTGLPPLPDVSLTGGRILVSRADGQQATVEGIEFSGDRQNPLVYTVLARAPGLTAGGELFPASGQRQQLHLQLDELPPELVAMFGLPEVSIAAAWQGGLVEGGAEGVIDVAAMNVGEVQTHGQLALSSLDGVTTIRPIAEKNAAGKLEGFIAENLPGEIGPINVFEGAIIAEAGTVRVEQLLAHAMEGEILVRDASASLADFALHLDLAFKNLQPREKAHLSGEITGSAGYDTFGKPLATLELLATGSIADTSVERLDLELTASGPYYHDWRTLDVLAVLRDSPLLIRPPEAPTTLPEARALVKLRLTDPVQPRIELAELTSLEPDVIDLRGWGVYYTADNPDHSHGDYLVSFEQSRLPVKLPRIEGRFPLDLGFDLRGRYYVAQDPADTVISPVTITRLYGELEDIGLEGTGTYVIIAEGMEPEPPLSLTLTLTRQTLIPSPLVPGAARIIAARRALGQPRVGEDDAASPAQVTELEAVAVQPIRGSIMSWLEVTGDPLAVQFQGTGGVLTSNFALGSLDLGAIQSLIDLELTADHLKVYTPRNQERTDLDREYAQIFGAHVDFEAVIPFGDQQPGHITLDIDQMQLTRVADALSQPAVSGTLDGHLAIELTGLSPSLATARGWFIIDHLGIPRSELAEQIVIGRPPRNEQDHPDGGLLLEKGSVNIPVELMQFAATAPGPTRIGEPRTLSFDVNYELAQPRRFQVLNVKGDAYPLVLPAAEAGEVHYYSELRLRSPGLLVSFEEAAPQVRGHLELQADVATGERPFELALLADGRLVAEATRATIELEELSIDLDDIGDIAGGGTIALDDIPGLSRIWLHGQKLDLAAAAERLKLPAGTEGLMDFSLTLQPGPGQHPQGEVLVNLAFAGTDARWRSVEIDQGQVMVYLSRVPRPDESPSRGQFDFTVATTERIRLHVAGGVLDGYFKLRNRRRVDDGGRWPLLSWLPSGGDDWYVNATLDGVGLDAAQIGALFETEDEIEGVITLGAVAYGNLNQRPRFGETQEDVPLFPLSGEGTLEVGRGELASFNLFQRPRELINVLTRTPQYDSAVVSFRLEQGNGYIDRLRAFVDGTEIHISGRLYDVLDPDETRIDGSGVIFAKPLAQIPLPFFREADELFSVIQSNATAFTVGGTIEDPEFRIVAFTEIAETLRVLLIPSMKR